MISACYVAHAICSNETSTTHGNLLEMSRSRLLSSPRSYLFSTGVTRPASGIRLNFKPLDSGDCESERLGAANFFMVITDISERKIMLTFHNQSAVNCAISEATSTSEIWDSAA